MKVEVVATVSPELVETIASLLPQLSSSSPPSAAELATIVASPATSLLVARDGDSVLGMLTLAVFRIPTGVRAWIEGVVVDESARGRGIGEALTLRAVELAREAGARSVELTSRGRESPLPAPGLRRARDERPSPDARACGRFVTLS
jgi:ribosomal protein S18 acetylase RimI-like enzyme